MKAFDDLAQLLAVIVALYVNELRRLHQAQMAVTRQDNAIFLTRRVDQTMPRQMSSIYDVPAQHSKPLSQPAEHAVGRELQFARVS